jgi:hypothetical protein
MGCKQTRCQLSDEAVRRIRESQALKLEIMALWKISESTLYRWLNKQSPLLTNVETVGLLKKQTDLKDSEILN